MTSLYEEFSGSDVDRAIDLAVKKIGEKRDRLQYDILSFGSTGIFGIVPARKAKIRVYLSPEEEKHKRKHSSRKTKKPEKKEKPPSVLVIEDFEKANSVEAEKLLAETEQKEQDNSVDKNKKTVIDPLQLEKNKELAKNMLQQILNQISPEAQFKIKEAAKKITYFVSGGDNAFLIGTKGQSVDAVRYLLDKILHRGTDEHRIRVEVDVDEYAKKKRQKLLQTATELIEKCEKTKEIQSLGRLGGSDRRIVQLLLKKYPNISTKSLGRGEKRTTSLLYAASTKPDTNECKP